MKDSLQTTHWLAATHGNYDQKQNGFAATAVFQSLISGLCSQKIMIVAMMTLSACLFYAINSYMILSM
jgi:hypothetical protein